MIQRLSANTASDQNGAAGRSSRAAIAASDAATMANQRPNVPPWNSDTPANPSSTPMIRVTHPQVFRLPNT